MPIYQYKCKNCGTKYELFFKVREEKDEIVCPNCSSRQYEKIISVINVGNSSKYSKEIDNLPKCSCDSCPY